jgi:hypothetical protein
MYLTKFHAHAKLKTKLWFCTKCSLCRLIDVHGASLYIVAANALGAARKLKVIHSVIT